jgi:hypothetical protein
VILLAVDRNAEGFEPLDIAMALRGLRKLHPYRVIINGNVRRKSDSLTIVEGVRERIVHDGISLIEGTAVTPEALWRPVPLSTYTPPSSLHLESPLPRIPGRSVADGKSCFLPATDEKAASSLPLLASTESGEIAGSIWWEAMKPQMLTGPIWLLWGKLLLFPNHAPLLISSGGTKTFSTSSTTLVPMDLFLLRIEEKERGTFSPDFEALWDHATVVIGSTDDIGITGSLHSILKSISFKRLPLLGQTLLALILIVVLFALRRVSQGKRLFIATAILLLVIGSGIIALNHNILLPLLAPLVTALCILLSTLPSYRRQDPK